MKSKYSNGFDVILENIINKYSKNPRKVKKYVYTMNIIFNGSCKIETTNLLFKFYLQDIKNKFEDKIKNVLIDCLKRTIRNKKYE